MPSSVLNLIYPLSILEHGQAMIRLGLSQSSIQHIDCIFKWKVPLCVLLLN